jgi:ElaB/YqjD/DUF883 family membrane-anchored ribosome-binding protein
MSEMVGQASSTTQEGVLYDESGNRIGPARSVSENVEPVVRFAREQPFTTVLLALGIGYLIGKLL